MLKITPTGESRSIRTSKLPSAQPRVAQEAALVAPDRVRRQGWSQALAALNLQEPETLLLDSAGANVFDGADWDWNWKLGN